MIDSAGFDCPACRKGKTSVVDSRPASKFHGVRRRRSCPECLHRFTTYEAHAKSAFFDVRERDKKIARLARSIVTVAKQSYVSGDDT